MRRQIFSLLFVILLSLVVAGCAGGGVNNGSGSATGGSVTTAISNFPCTRIGKVEIGCANQGTQPQDSKSQNPGTTTSTANQLQSGTTCGSAAMNMACPSIAIPGTDCRRCQ